MCNDPLDESPCRLPTRNGLSPFHERKPFIAMMSVHTIASVCGMLDSHATMRPKASYTVFSCPIKLQSALLEVHDDLHCGAAHLGNHTISLSCSNSVVPIGSEDQNSEKALQLSSTTSVDLMLPHQIADLNLFKVITLCCSPQVVPI